MKQRRLFIGGITVAIIAWLAITVWGTVLMTRYSTTAGSEGKPPLKWPADTRLQSSAMLPTLIMFTHPQCACSRASVAELEVLLSKFPNKINAHVVFLKPVGTVADWEKTDLWRKASSIPGVTVHTDNAGDEARCFHAETSGETLLYDQAGALRFQGGITGGRGHEGDNAGLSALEDVLRDGHPVETKFPVFGCSLFESKSK